MMLKLGVPMLSFLALKLCLRRLMEAVNDFEDTWLANTFFPMRQTQSI